ncbi:MAG: hypothetical protein WAW69_06230 [Polaromonas sp.]
MSDTASLATDTVTKSQTVPSICTPEQHAQANKAKPVTLLELGIGPHGKTALLEFPEGWQRTIDLLTEFDGWHPLFDDLPHEDRRRLHTHVLAPFVTHPDGTQSRPEPLSFIRRVHSARGKFVKFTYFDVPLEKYGDGAITGYHCASELLDALALGHGPHISLNRVMEEAAEARGGDFYGVNRRAAAIAFLEVVGDALVFFAKHSNHRPWLSRNIARAEEFRDAEAERSAIKRAEFVERMKVAKAAKRTVSQELANA